MGKGFDEICADKGFQVDVFDFGSGRARRTSHRAPPQGGGCLPAGAGGLGGSPQDKAGGLCGGSPPAGSFSNRFKFTAKVTCLPNHRAFGYSARYLDRPDLGRESQQP
jgi:hypothetical protein